MTERERREVIMTVSSARYYLAAEGKEYSSEKMAREVAFKELRRLENKWGVEEVKRIIDAYDKGEIDL